MKKAQISMEYVAIVGVVFLVLSGTLYLFLGYARSSQTQLTETQLNVISNDILNTASEMFYLGEASKKVLTIEMPDGIENFGLVVKDSSGESYLIFKVYSDVGDDGVNQIMFESAVRLGCDTSGECSTPSSIHDQCVSEFTCYEFNQEDYSPGIKHFKIETKDDGTNYYADIDEVSDELS